MKRTAIVLMFVLSPALLAQTFSVSGHVVDPTSAAASNSRVVFTLVGTGNQQCKVSGTGLMVPTTETFTPSSGVISGTLYRNDFIVCGNQSNTQWKYQVFDGGKPQPSCTLAQITSSSLNLDNTACSNTNPVVTPPTGDNTYCRLDGSNCGFTGNVTLNGHALSAGAVTASSLSTSAIIGPVTISAGGVARLQVNNSTENWNYSVLRSMMPAPDANFPLGHDFNAGARGPADYYAFNGAFEVTGTTSVSPGTASVTLTNPLYENATPPTITTQNAPNGGVANATCPANYFTPLAAATIEPGDFPESSTNQEFLIPTIVDCTHVSFTFAKSHTQPFVIRYQGLFFPEGYGMKMIADSFGRYNYWTVFDPSGNNALLQFPKNTGAWPNCCGTTFPSPITGANGATKDLVVRLNNASSNLFIQNATGSTNLDSFDNNGNVASSAGFFTPSVGSFVAKVQDSGGTGIVQADIFQMNGNVGTGNFRLTSAGNITFRNNANTQTLNGLSKNTSDVFILGDALAGGVAIKGGINNTTSTGIQTKHGVAGCATAASVGAACTTTVTWTTAFADTNYTVSCGGELVTSGVPVVGGVTGKSTTSVTFQTVAATAAAAQFTGIDCEAIHD